MVQKPMSTQTSGAEHVEQVIGRAHQELESLLKQRAAIIKRIGTIKQTILGLANLFGDDVIGDELLELIDHRSDARQPGFTTTCRMILMESNRPSADARGGPGNRAEEPGLASPAESSSGFGLNRAPPVGQLWRGPVPSQR